MTAEHEHRKETDRTEAVENEIRRIGQFCNKLKGSIIIWYILALVAWAMFPYGLFDKEGLLDIKRWEFFLVCSSFGWFLWFALSTSRKYSR